METMHDESDVTPGRLDAAGCCTRLGRREGEHSCESGRADLFTSAERPCGHADRVDRKQSL